MSSGMSAQYDTSSPSSSIGCLPNATPPPRPQHGAAGSQLPCCGRLAAAQASPVAVTSAGGAGRSAEGAATAAAAAAAAAAAIGALAHCSMGTASSSPSPTAMAAAAASSSLREEEELRRLQQPAWYDRYKPGGRLQPRRPPAAPPGQHSGRVAPGSCPSAAAVQQGPQGAAPAEGPVAASQHTRSALPRAKAALWQLSCSASVSTSPLPLRLCRPPQAQPKLGLLSVGGQGVARWQASAAAAGAGAALSGCRSAAAHGSPFGGALRLAGSMSSSPLAERSMLLRPAGEVRLTTSADACRQKVERRRVSGRCWCRSAAAAAHRLP